MLSLEYVKRMIIITKQKTSLLNTNISAVYKISQVLKTRTSGTIILRMLTVNDDHVDLECVDWLYADWKSGSL